MIRLGAEGWELHPGIECGNCDPYPGLRDRLWARMFLGRIASDPLAADAIRHALWCGVHPWTMTKTMGVDAVGQMADLLSRGIWHVHAPPLPDDQGGGGSEVEAEEEDMAEIAQAPAASDGPAPRPAPPPEEGSLPRNADEAAIAAGMKLASLLGIPFCEECAKAALKRAREAAVA
jgi:hypothetical protein